MQQELRERLPTFSEIIYYYGPYVGLVLLIIIVILVLQYIWFKRVIKTKDEEIKRLRENEKQANDKYLFMVDKKIEHPDEEK